MPRRPCRPGTRLPRRPRLFALLPALLVLQAAAPAMAQTPFAMRALGQNLETDSARDTARGGWGMAASDTLAPGTRNCAALADLRYLGLIISTFGETTVSSGGGFERTTRQVYLPNIRLGVPLRQGRLALHAGFSALRSMKYETAAELQLEHFGEPVLGSEHYYRDGTLYAIPLGLSWRATPSLAVAATVNLVRGQINDAVSQVFTDPPGSYYLPSVREQRDELSGSNLTLAALWDGSPLLQLGASVTTGYDLGMDRTLSLSGVAERARDHYTGAMPPQYKAGLILRLSSAWRFGVDGAFAGYSGFRGRPDWEPQLRDEWSVAAGFERGLAFRPHGRGYTLPLRFGCQHRRWAHTVGGAEVSETAVSAGTGFPFRNRLGAIDLALSYVWIGSLNDNGWRSNSLRLGVSITGLERLVF